MSKNVAMFVDVANMYYAARGQDVDVDYVALLKHATKGRDLIRAYAYTGLDPENENQRKFIDFLGKNGYKPVVKDIRKFGDGRMKANLDIELVVDLFRLADRMDIAVVVSGDGDFAPAIKALQDKGVRAEVISFKPNTSSDLIAVADEFVDIMKIASISRKEARATQRGMTAPEMPAKEVSPEFGFREASPSVAAAALAALKSGADGGNRRRRRSTPKADEEAGADVTVAAAVTDADGDAEEATRRRRRRRGGRGRGRGRRDEEPATAVAAEPSQEVGWEEFDDLSQLEGLDEAEAPSFSEADAETLAELGLTPEEVETMATTRPPETEAEAKKAEAKAAEAEAQAKPKARRRSTRKAAEEPAGETEAEADAKPKTRRRSTRAAEEKPAAEAETEAKPKARRRSTRKAAEEPAGETEAETDAKPKTRRRSTKKAEEATAASETAGAEPAQSEEPQGIWGRFRSARTPRDTSS